MIREDFLFPLIDLDVPITDETLMDLGSVLPERTVKAYIERAKDAAKQDRMWQWARANFKNEDESPWEMSPGELVIYKLIAFRQYPRSQIITPTQYGKTLTVSRGLLTRVTTYPEEWLLVVPDTKRGKLTIRYMIRDTAQNEYFTEKLFGLKTEDTLLMRLLEEKSKVKLTYQILEDDNIPRYGSVEILSTDARRQNNAITGIMGFGGRNVVADESALCSDEIDAGVFRMLAGKGADTFLLKIGNPFFRNHFSKSWTDPKYRKVFIDYLIGLYEGRYEKEFIDEALQKPQADVLWHCRFPGADKADDTGWIPLLTESEVREAMQPGAHFGEERIGADVADTGENESVLVKRSSGYAEVVFGQSTSSLMDFTGMVVMETEATRAKRVYIDSVGVGAGVYSRVQEVNNTDKKGMFKVFGINAGEKPQDNTQYFNRRAEMYWRVRTWIKSGGKLNADKRWYQLTKVFYKAASNGKLQIMPKDQMRKRGIASPDVADALSLTFAEAPVTLGLDDEDKFFLRKMHQNERQTKRQPGPRPMGNMPPR